MQKNISQGKAKSYKYLLEIFVIGQIKNDIK